MLSRNRLPKAVLAATVSTMLLAGCSSYYHVRDPASGKNYYTGDVDRAGAAGAVKFKDAKSGATVTLQNSEVKEISKDEFTKATTTPPPAK
jgi:hypothetical protein